MEWDHRLYLARLKRKESLKTVSQAVGCSAMYLSEMENGKRPKESKIIKKLEKYYGFAKSANEQPTIYAAYTALIEHNVQIAQITGLSVEALNERNERLIRSRDMMPLAVAEAVMDK